ncbi:MAG: hypothetical protein ACYTGQ_06235 [Planctomycetota bacterium]
MLLASLLVAGCDEEVDPEAPLGLNGGDKVRTGEGLRERVGLNMEVDVAELESMESGAGPAEVEALRAELERLRNENAMLRGELLTVKGELARLKKAKPEPTN